MTVRETEGADTPPARKVVARYLHDFELLLREINPAAVERVVNVLRTARDGGATIYIAGNGGSSATASHWANDLGKATKTAGRGWIRVMCLSDNTPWLTALANDEGYERAFAGQLENFAGPGDVFVAISASGNSPNLVHAVELANERGLATIALLGFDGGALKDRVTESLWTETEAGAYGLVETAHSVLCDVITTCLIEDRAESLAIAGTVYGAAGRR